MNDVVRYDRRPKAINNAANTQRILHDQATSIVLPILITRRLQIHVSRRVACIVAGEKPGLLLNRKHYKQ